MNLLLNLPDPILEQILKELDPISLTYISFVCKKLYQESSKDKYWVNLIQTEIFSHSFRFFQFFQPNEAKTLPKTLETN